MVTNRSKEDEVEIKQIKDLLSKTKLENNVSSTVLSRLCSECICWSLFDRLQIYGAADDRRNNEHMDRM